MPPNATLVSAMYNSRKRNEVDLEWQVENKEGSGLTGFILEHVWLSEQPGRRDSGNTSGEGRAERIGPPVWYRSIIQDPEARSHTVGSLTPTVTYQFRITSVNHRTVGHTSAAKTPGTISREWTKRGETQFPEKSAEKNSAVSKSWSELLWSV